MQQAACRGDPAAVLLRCGWCGNPSRRTARCRCAVLLSLAGTCAGAHRQSQQTVLQRGDASDCLTRWWCHPADLAPHKGMLTTRSRRGAAAAMAKLDIR